MLVDTQKLIASEIFIVNSIIFVHDPPVTMMKNTIFNDNFRAFSIVFDHANTCTSMCSLVKIHNSQAFF